MSEPTIQEMFDLSGRVALVTGAAGHLGGAMARALAECGANVVAASRDLARAERMAGSLPTSIAGQQHFAVAFDQLDDASLDAGFEAALSAAGKLDILVNNGHEADPHDWTNVAAERFDRQLAHATAYFLLARRLRDHVVARQSPGSIVMLGSMYGVVGSYPEAYAGVAPASGVHYHALKGGIVHMTRHLAVYWAKDNVRVNCLSPGPFPSSKAPPQLVERLKARSPLGRMGEPHELKGALVLLASDAGSYLTGQNLLVDGGWTAW